MRKIIILLVFILGINSIVAQDRNSVDTRQLFFNDRNDGMKISTPTTKQSVKKTTKKSTNDKKNEISNDTELDNKPIGLGYTVYLRDGKDNGVRVDPERVFKSGDAVRLSLEPNIDGYLYIFYVENNKEPELLYPDARLNAGDNQIKAHVPIEIPSRTTVDPKFRWFFFIGNPAREKLYVIVSRNSLPNIPIGKELVKYSQENKNSFRPNGEIWNIVKTKVGESNLVSRNNDYGQPQSEVENQAITRQFRLGNDAPIPSTVEISKSVNTDIFVTLVELKHN